MAVRRKSNALVIALRDFGVRPEDVTVSNGAESARSRAMRSRVDVVETLGAERPLFWTSESCSLLVRVSSEFSAHVDDRVSVSIDPAKLDVFDWESGLASNCCQGSKRGAAFGTGSRRSRFCTCV